MISTKEELQCKIGYAIQEEKKGVTALFANSLRYEVLIDSKIYIFHMKLNPLITMS